MTDKDMDDAANALISWFQSQGIKPADGSIIMSRVIATQLVAKSQIVDELQEAVRAIYMLLNIDIADELRKRIC